MSESVAKKILKDVLGTVAQPEYGGDEYFLEVVASHTDPLEAERDNSKEEAELANAAIEDVEIERDDFRDMLSRKIKRNVWLNKENKRLKEKIKRQNSDKKYWTREAIEWRDNKIATLTEALEGCKFAKNGDARRIIIYKALQATKEET